MESRRPPTPAHEIAAQLVSATAGSNPGLGERRHRHETSGLTQRRRATIYSVPIQYELRPVAARSRAMIILSKLADYGVILATHMAAEPDRQATATSLAAET